MSPINWDRELAKIEREFDGLPPVPPRTAIRARSGPRGQVMVRGPEHASPLAARIAVWARLIFVASLPAALVFWPYPKECGAWLYAFMGAGAMIVIGGIWVAFCTWQNRMGLAHTLALALVLAGLACLGQQILPRISYARETASSPPHWRCSAPPAPGIVRWGHGGHASSTGIAR